MKIIRRWPIRPLRKLEADVPLPYRIKAPEDAPTIVSVSLSINDTVLIDAEGLVRNIHGTALFRLADPPCRTTRARRKRSSP